VPIATDEHGAVFPDPTTPLYVATEDADERWTAAMRLAMRISGQSELDVGTRNLAAAFYFSAAPTSDEVPPRERRTGRLREALHAPTYATRRALATAAQLRHRNREGEFLADGRVVPRRFVSNVPPRPPRSPGFTPQEIEEMGLNKMPEPSKLAIELLGGHRTSALRWTVPASPGTDEREDSEKEHPPYAEERRPIHDLAVGRALAGLPTEQREHPTGIAELLGVDHWITKLLAKGGRLDDDAKEIVREAAREARGGDRPHALFLAGGPGSGKTTVLRENLALRPANAVTVDPDDLKSGLPEYVDLLAAEDRYAAVAVHDESGDLAARLAAEARDLELNVVMDGTGDGEPGSGTRRADGREPGGFVKELVRKRDAGYKVGLLYVTLPTHLAVNETILRWQETGRYVPVPVVRKLHAKVSEVFVKDIEPLTWLEHLDIFERKTHIATRSQGALHEFDRARVANFRDKQHELEEARDSRQDSLVEEAPMEPKKEPRAAIFEIPMDFDEYLSRPVPTYVDAKPKTVNEPVEDTPEAPAD
jgi:predicted ABC-type ATPase